MSKIVRGSAKRVLVIGTPAPDATLPEEALAPDGMLILMERDPIRAEQARRRFSSAGLDTRATVIAGDPRRMLYKLAGPFDLVFYADHDLSLREKLITLLARNGVLITNDEE